MAIFDIIEIQSENDIYIALSKTRQAMDKLSFSEMNKQKVFVSVSELTRNILIHANGKGRFKCELLRDGICVIVIDQGPGIAHVEEVLRGAKIRSKTGLGLGLTGVKRLMDEFYVETGEGGTKIIAVKWRETPEQVRRDRSDVKQIGIHWSNFSGHRS